MYTIIGGDGRQYGPASADQVRQWIAAGRANAQTLAQATGAIEWKPLAAFPDFADLAVPPVMVPPAPAPPVLPPASASRPARSNGLATAGLIFGIMAITVGIFCCGPFWGALGLICSCLGLAESEQAPSSRSGRGEAIAGIVLSICGILFWLLLTMLWGFHGWRGPFLRYRSW